MRPRLLITGGSGFLGRCLRGILKDTWHIGYGYFENTTGGLPGEALHLDIRDQRHVDGVFSRWRPEIVVHAAATMESDLLDSVVIRGSENVARAATGIGARLVHLSTDMVFDGEHAPYSESSPPRPVTAYGNAKAVAEARVQSIEPTAVIIRTSLLYSIDPPDPRTSKDLMSVNAGDPITLFHDEKRCPAEGHDLARSLTRLLDDIIAGYATGTQEPPNGIYHLMGPEVLTRWQLGTSLLRALGADMNNVHSGRAADLGLIRPRDLTLESVRAPASWHLPFRSLKDVLAEHRDVTRRQDRPETRGAV